MIFTSFAFVAFFAVVILVRSHFQRLNAEKWFLLSASVCFYLASSIPCVFLILFTALADFSVTQKIARTNDPISRKRLLIVSLVVNLGLLGFFKYSNFFLENLVALLSVLGCKVGPFHFDIILPPGISYFTFASMSYVLDVYYERVPACSSARDYMLFITFFPKLLSGPIVRAKEFLPQLREQARASAEDFEIGVAYVMVGAVKKLVIADQVASHVNLIFSTPSRYDGFTLLQGLLGYAIQIYCDFSGYADMAIGCARILGFHFPENFQMPFSSVSITEFWRRWHITLSKWFRDYVFIPLEVATRDNSNPVLRVSMNLMLVMFLVGLWHGASWNFITVGVIHGLALALHQVWMARNPFESMNKIPMFRFVWTQCSRLLTLSVVLLGFVFFRTPSVGDAVEYLGGMVSWGRSGTRMISPYILLALVAVFLVHVCLHKDQNWAERIAKRPMAIRILGYACVVLLLVCLSATDAAPFIYFQF